GGGMAWPSGHTSSHMALASSLVAFYPDEVWLPFVAYPFVALIGLAAVEDDHHWLSDVVAAGFTGHAIGWTVGTNMRRRYDAAHGRPTPKESSWRILPMPLRDGFGVTVSF
ncbi:MAG: phosphatase PAP2 family protein, partial [Myxococcales bacterium]|nr:phosphatase PAP2 family protein [Myxococcales bacterium]